MVAPVSACLIVRNEEAQIERCLKSIRPYVAEIICVDTGSTDRTVEIARRFADRVEVYTTCNEEGRADGLIEDFSLARQRSFDLATQPWIIWVDGDDELRGAENIEAIVKRHENDPPTMVMFPYEYSHDHHGNVTCRHYRERLIKPPKCGHWFGPVHEVFIPDVPVNMVQSDEVTFVHRRAGKAGDPTRNLRILKRWFDKHGESDVRFLYYLGLEYANSGDLAKSIEFHEKYVAKSGWEDEKCLSLLELAKHWQNLDELEKSIDCCFRAMRVKENWAEPRFWLGRAYYFLAKRGGVDAVRNWERCANFIQQGLALPPTKTPLFINELDRAYDVHIYLNMALSALGKIDEALDSVETALKVAPDDPNLLFNKAFYTEAIAKSRIDQMLTKLISVGKASEEQRVLVQRILDGKFARAPEQRKGNEFQVTTETVSDALAQVSQSNSAKLDIIIFTGGAWELWTPETLERGGMGGSETMAWEMARRLKRLGHRVRVYADCKGQEGTFEGVEWIHFQSISNDWPECDVLTSSRIAELVDYPIKAKLKLGWVHDIHMGGALTNKRALKFDRFLCLSNWHKEFFCETYKFLHPDSVIVTRNGIDLGRYTQTVERDPHRMIYSSSPDRGLQVALQCMPAVRAAVPDASLHVYYGFDNWEKHPDKGQRDLAQAIKGMIQAFSAFGVINHGRVSGKQLATEQLKSGVWAYSSWFSETSCLSAMEAQAAGVRMVTSPIAALRETAGPRARMIGYGSPEGGNVDWLSPEYAKAYTTALIEELTRPGDDDRNALKRYAAENFSLDTLATDWEAMFHRLIAEVAACPIQKYRAAS